MRWDDGLDLGDKPPLGLAFFQRYRYSNKPGATQLGRSSEKLEGQAISVVLLPPTVSKIISHPRKIMEHGDAVFTEYPRGPHHVREAASQSRGDDGVQRFEDLDVLTHRKPIKGLTTSDLLNGGHTGIAGHGQQSFPAGAHKSVYIVAAFLHYSEPCSGQGANVTRYG